MREIRLWVEFILFFVGVPLGLAVLLPPENMYPVLLGSTVLGLVLLHFTPGFAWRDLFQGIGTIDWRFVMLFTLATFLVGGTVMLLTRPDALFLLIRERPEVVLMIAFFYPPVLALPQEVVFRPLFFRRYAAILPAGAAAIVLNAALFSFAHLMYWSWIVAAMTFSGGLAFAWAYEVKKNFPEAVVLHSLAGIVVFLLGLGVYFYSGNVVKPF